MENKYSQGKIYRIVCNVTGLCYIGSTTYDTLSRRLYCHNSGYKRWKENPQIHKCSSVQVMENGNYDIILIESYPCSNRDELRSRERYYIETMDCVNKIIPTRTRKEYRDGHKEEINQYNYDYYHSNQDREKERTKVYNQNNPEKVKQWNKVKSELPPISCECGLTYTYKHKARHMMTKKHLDLTKISLHNS